MSYGINYYNTMKYSIIDYNIIRYKYTTTATRTNSKKKQIQVDASSVRAIHKFRSLIHMAIIKKSKSALEMDWGPR